MSIFLFHFSSRIRLLFEREYWALRLVLAIGIVSFFTPSTRAQAVRPIERGKSRIEHYMQFARPVGSARLDFVGPGPGIATLRLNIRQPYETGDTLLRPGSFVIDLNNSHDGVFFAPDTQRSISNFTPFQFQLDSAHILHAELAPSRSRENLREFDSTIEGTLGYAFFNRYVTVLDLKKGLVTFYSLFANIDIAKNDSNALQLPILDDAMLSYCHCPFSTLWIEANAPPLKPGHVHLSFDEPTSIVFTTALDERTRKILKDESVEDSLRGKPKPAGLSLARFITAAGDIARHGHHRIVRDLPPLYRDLTVPILGALGTDVLRTFSAIIIDPSRAKLTFVK